MFMQYTYVRKRLSPDHYVHAARPPVFFTVATYFIIIMLAIDQEAITLSERVISNTTRCYQTRKALKKQLLFYTRINKKRHKGMLFVPMN